MRWLLIVVAGCGSQAPAATEGHSEANATPLTATVEPTALGSETREHFPSEPTPPEEATVEPVEPVEPVAPVAPAAVGNECTDAHDCVVVADRCGRPYGRPRSRAVAPRAPELCPPAAYALTEPACEQGVCEAVVAAASALRGCEAPRDCVASSDACGGWWAFARSEREGAERFMQQENATRACDPAPPTPAPRVSCMRFVCVTR